MGELKIIALVFLFAPGYLLAAPKCSDPLPMSELVASSDLIAVVQQTRRNVQNSLGSILSGAGTKIKINSLDANIIEIIKEPYVQGFNQSANQRLLVTPYVLKKNDPARAVVFLRYLGGNSWAVPQCAMLPLDNNNNVYEACNSISDIFAHDRFLRERRCLLATPGIISLSDLQTEIKRNVVNARGYSGPATVIKTFKWRPEQAFQRAVLSFRVRELKKLLPYKVRTSQLRVMGYFPTELFSRRAYKQTFRKGRRVKLRATWFKGNLVVDEVQN